MEQQRQLGLAATIAVVTGESIALGIFLNLVGQYWSFVGSVLQLPVAFATLLIILLIKPTGLFGHRTVRKV